MTQGPIVIIGGGPAGLGAAWMLERSGFHDWILYEREETVGGLSRSFRDDQGYTWDIGGHVTFSHYGVYSDLLDEILGEDGWIEHERESWVRLLGLWVPYPFQNNIHRLPPKERAACAEGLIRAALDPPTGRFADFDEFIQRTFGAGVAEIFMRPYNYKVWAYHPTKMAADWIAERVSVPDPVRIARNLALGTDDCSWGPNNTFRFPKHGGTGAIWEAVAGALPADKIITGCAATAVDPEKRKVTFDNGDVRDYEALITTMPLDRFAALCGREDWIAATAQLRYSSTYTIGLGIKGTAPGDLRTKCWMYFPEENCPFYRVTHFSFYSPNNSPDIKTHWSLMAEVSESPDKAVDADRVIAETISGAIAAGLLEKADQVDHTYLQRVEYSYPVPTRGRDEILNRLLPELHQLGILSRGRFGAWRYEVGNMDHSFMQGFEAAGRLLHGSAELTLWHPEIVNQPHPVLGWRRTR